MKPDPGLQIDAGRRPGAGHGPQHFPERTQSGNGIGHPENRA